MQWLQSQNIYRDYRFSIPGLHSTPVPADPLKLQLRPDKEASNSSIKKSHKNAAHFMEVLQTLKLSLEKVQVKYTLQTYRPYQ
jgi:hypothetical protein